jgi:hypothetical protein
VSLDSVYWKLTAGVEEIQSPTYCQSFPFLCSLKDLCLSFPLLVLALDPLLLSSMTSRLIPFLPFSGKGELFHLVSHFSSGILSSESHRALLLTLTVLVCLS